MILRDVETRDLIERAQQGQVESYNLLVSHWEKRVYNYLLKLVRNREDALDLCQETFLKAYQNLRKLEDPAKFASWLFRIAHNEAYSQLRRNRPDSQGEELMEVAEAGQMAGASISSLQPVETTLAVETAMRRLSAEQREVVILKIYQGFKFEEIAEVLSIPLSTVKSRLYAALDLLKDTLAPADASSAIPSHRRPQ